MLLTQHVRHSRRQQVGLLRIVRKKFHLTLLTTHYTRPSRGVFTQTLTPEALVKRLAGSAIDLTKSPDRGQRVYTAALRHSDSNVRRAAITLVAAMAEGNDFGYDPDSMGSRNEGPIQDIVSFIATRR